MQEIQQKSIDECISEGLEIRADNDKSRWQLGDLASYVTEEFGSEHLVEFSIKINIQKSTLRRYRDVSRAWPKEIRRQYEMVPWSIYRMISAQDNRMDLLKLAHDESMTVEQVQRILKQESEKDPIPAKPKIEYCENCGRWGLLEQYDFCKTPNDHA